MRHGLRSLTDESLKEDPELRIQDSSLAQHVAEQMRLYVLKP